MNNLLGPTPAECNLVIGFNPSTMNIVQDEPSKIAGDVL
jgi:hypothetical protein